MDYALLEVGKLYPGEIPIGEGGKFDIDDSGPVLLLHWNKISSKEMESVANGPIKVALTVLEGFIFVLFKYGDLSWMDMPYNVHLSKNLTRLESPEPTQGYALNTILVDIVSKEVKALRFTGLPYKFSMALKKALDEQKEMPVISPAEQSTIINRIYAKYSTKDLLSFAIVQQNC